MDIISLFKIVFKISLALIPFVLLIAIVTAYTSDLTSLIGYLTDNPLILIMALTMESALEVTYIAVLFGLSMMALGILGVFRVFG